MLIVHVITRLLRAGSEENTLASCHAQARAGHEVILVHGNEWNRSHAVDCGNSFKLIEMKDLVHKIDPARDIKATRAMAALFRELRPTVVHTHQSKAGIVGRIAAKMADVPVIVHSIHVVPFLDVGLAKKLIYVTAERAVAGITNAFINVCEGTKQSYLDFSVGRVDQHHIAHSGMDLTRFQNAPWPEDWRAILGVADSEDKPPTILMLAAFEARKRHVAFLEAFVRVVRRIPDVRLVLAGEGATRAAAEAKIAALGLGANVRVVGFHRQPEQLIALADITVLTSTREGMPRVIVQAFAGGRPEVTTDLPGISELVSDGVNGLITPGDDLGVTADALCDLLTNPARLAALRLGAARTDVSSWSVDSMCSVISAVYDQHLPRAVAGVELR